MRYGLGKVQEHFLEGLSGINPLPNASTWHSNGTLVCQGQARIRAQASASRETAYEEEENTEAQSDTELSFTSSLCDLRAAVFQIYQSKEKSKFN